MSFSRFESISLWYFYIFPFSRSQFYISTWRGTWNYANSFPLKKETKAKKYRVSQKHGNSVTNSISSLLWISIAIPNFKSYNIIMSARVYFMKRVKACKDVSLKFPQDEQWRLTSLLCLYHGYIIEVCILQFSCFTQNNQGAETSCVCVCTKRVCVSLKYRRCVL